MMLRFYTVPAPGLRRLRTRQLCVDIPRGSKRINMMTAGILPSLFEDTLFQAISVAKIKLFVFDGTGLKVLQKLVDRRKEAPSQPSNVGSTSASPGTWRSFRSRCGEKPTGHSYYPAAEQPKLLSSCARAFRSKPPPFAFAFISPAHPLPCPRLLGPCPSPRRPRPARPASPCLPSGYG
jgi:hypothetical protein